jgi:hypothetical protein
MLPFSGGERQNRSDRSQDSSLSRTTMHEAKLPTPIPRLRVGNRWSNSPGLKKTGNYARKVGSGLTGPAILAGTIAGIVEGKKALDANKAHDSIQSKAEGRELEMHERQMMLANLQIEDLRSRPTVIPANRPSIWGGLSRKDTKKITGDSAVDETIRSLDATSRMKGTLEGALLLGLALAVTSGIFFAVQRIRRKPEAITLGERDKALLLEMEGELERTEGILDKCEEDEEKIALLRHRIEKLKSRHMR